MEVLDEITLETLVCVALLKQAQAAAAVVRHAVILRNALETHPNSSGRCPQH